MKRNRISIIGGYGSGNFGDDALIYLLYGALRDVPDLNLTFIGKKNNYYSILCPNIKFRNISKPLPEGDVLIYGGGTQFFAFKKYKSNRGTLFLRLYRFLLNPKKVIDYFNRFRKKRENNYNKIFALGIGLGPFYEEGEFYKKTIDLFRKMDWISVRDKGSLEICKNWGIESAELYSDICFSYQWLNNNKINESKPKLGIILRKWPFDNLKNDYLQHIKELGKWALVNGFSLTYIFFELNESKYFKENGILKSTNNFLEWNPINNTIDSFLDELSSFDIIITARYHGAVFATILNIPFISIAIEPKLEILLEEFGLSQFIWREPFNLDDCTKMINDLLSNISVLKKHLYENSIREKDKADHMLQQFFIKLQKYIK